MAQPFLSVELVLQHYPECCLPQERENRGVWGETWSGAYRKSGHEDHVSLLWRAEEMAESGCQRWQASSPRGHTALLASCTVLSWQRKGLLVEPLRSAACSKSTRPSKTKWRPSQLPARKPGSLVTRFPRCQATFMSSFAPTSVSSTCSKVSCVHRGFRTVGPDASRSPGLSILKGSLLPNLPAYPAPFPCMFTKSCKSIQVTPVIDSCSVYGALAASRLLHSNVVDLVIGKGWGQGSVGQNTCMASVRT